MPRRKTKTTVEKKPKKPAADKKQKPKPKPKASRNHNVRASVVQSVNNPMSQLLPPSRGWTMVTPSLAPITIQQPLGVSSWLAPAMQRQDPFKYVAAPVDEKPVMETRSQPNPSIDAPSTSGVRQRIHTFENLSPGGPWPIPKSNKTLRDVLEAIRQERAKHACEKKNLGL
jgi:hypothetical protein